MERPLKIKSYKILTILFWFIIFPGGWAQTIDNVNQLLHLWENDKLDDIYKNKERFASQMDKMTISQSHAGWAILGVVASNKKDWQSAGSYFKTLADRYVNENHHLPPYEYDTIFSHKEYQYYQDFFDHYPLILNAYVINTEVRLFEGKIPYLVIFTHVPPKDMSLDCPALNWHILPRDYQSPVIVLEIPIQNKMDEILDKGILSVEVTVQTKGHPWQDLENPFEDKKGFLITLSLKKPSVFPTDLNSNLTEFIKRKKELLSRSAATSQNEIISSLGRSDFRNINVWLILLYFLSPSAVLDVADLAIFIPNGFCYYLSYYSYYVGAQKPLCPFLFPVLFPLSLGARLAQLGIGTCNMIIPFRFCTTPGVSSAYYPETVSVFPWLRTYRYFSFPDMKKMGDLVIRMEREQLEQVRAIESQVDALYLLKSNIERGYTKFKENIQYSLVFKVDIGPLSKKGNQGYDNQ